MSDRYIDIEEMVRYGEYFRDAASHYVSLDPFVSTLIRSQQTLLEELAGLLPQKQGSTSGFIMSHQEQRTLSEEVRVQLSCLYTDLKSAQKKGIAFDFTTFFPSKTEGDIGRSIADRKAAVNRCITGLKLYPQVPDATGWLETLTALQNRFTSTISTTTSKDSSKVMDNQSFQKLRRRWKRSYLACKRGMAAVLILAERESELASVFYDLQQSSPVAATSGASTSTTGASSTGASSTSSAPATGTSSAPVSDSAAAGV